MEDPMEDDLVSAEASNMTDKSSKHIPQCTEQTLPQLKLTSLSHINHLIIVCCHAIWKGGQNPEKDEDEWFLEPFQRHEHTAFYNHAMIGLEALRKDDKAVLCFSGGATKQHLTSLTEGQSYLRLARHICKDENYRQRLMAEVFATDSYQNLLFSLIAYRSRLGRWPQHITVVSHDFKRNRFMEEHRKAIRWPAHTFTFIGLDPPESLISRAELDVSENANRLYWQNDLYGVKGRLVEKRRDRGWRDWDSYEAMIAWAGYVFDSAIGKLLEYDGGEEAKSVFQGSLPWDVGSMESQDVDSMDLRDSELRWTG